MPRSLDHIALVVRDPVRTAQLFSKVFDDARIEHGADDGDGDHDTQVQLGGVCLVLVRGTPPATRSVESDSASHQAVEVLPLVPVTASSSSMAEGLS